MISAQQLLGSDVGHLNQESEHQHHPHHDEEVLLLNTSKPPFNEMLKIEVNQPDEQESFKNKLIVYFIYALLIGTSLSIIYFSLHIYKEYSIHQDFLNHSLENTKISVSKRQTQIQTSINKFKLDLSDRLQNFNSKLEALQSKITQIKKESQYKFDKIQLFSLKNTQDLNQINSIINQQKAYAQEIKNYHNEIDIINKENLNFFMNENQEMTRIESIAWVYVENYNNDDQYLRKLSLNNLKKNAYLSSFEIKFINKDNYLYFLSSDMLSKVTNVFSMLEKRLSSHDRSNLGDHFETIKKIMIMVAILYEHGGAIFIDSVTLTEPLSWLHDANILKGFGHASSNMPPQVISFSNNYYSSHMITFSTNFYREVYQFPNIERYFMAAIKKCEFIGRIFEEMIGILTTPTTIKKQISEKYDMGLLRGDDPYYEFFYISSHLVLQKKQKELDLISTDDKKLYATDYYGLYTINCLHGPMKLKYHFKDQSEIYINNNLMDITRKEFQEKIGKIRFLHIFHKYQQSNRQLLNIRDNKRSILNGSFIHELLLDNVANQNFLYNRIEQVQQNNKQWNDLPKKLWIYTNGQENSQFGKQIMQSNTKFSKQVGYEVLAINSKVMSFYLSKEVLNDVTDKFVKSRFAHSSVKDYTLMLCLLSSQGGVYMDSSFILLEDLQWLTNINKAQPRLMVNRMGNNPKMFMFHNNHNRKNYTYKFNQKLHSRFDSRLIYEKSFIAVEKDSLLLQEWIEEILKSINMTDEQLDRKFDECGIKSQVQYKSNLDLFPLDILRCLYIKGLNSLKIEDYGKQANHYNIWSVDGDYSFLKIRESANYENADHAQNKYVAHIGKTEAEERIGPIYKMLKIDSQNMDYLNGLYNSRGDNPYQKLHRESIFAKYFLIKA